MADDDFLEFVLDQLSALPDVTYRRMFGGLGLYESGVFFAVIGKGRLYFKTDDESRAHYEKKGMKESWAVEISWLWFWKRPMNLMRQG